VSAKVITPNIGWYAISYTGLSLKHFFVKVDKLSSVVLTGCNCPGDQFFLLDNGTPLTLLNNCYREDPIPPNCSVSLSSPLACVTNSTAAGTMTIPFVKVIPKKDKPKAALQPEPIPLYCALGGYVFPGSHNITVIVSKALYPLNEAYIRVDSVCHDRAGETLPCCVADDSLPGPNGCVDAIVG